jgi:hypothetical protein
LILPSTAFWLLLGWLLLFLVWVLPFSVLGQPETTVSAIASKWPVILAVQWALGLVTAACMVSRLSRDLRRCARMDVPDAESMPRASAQASSRTLDQLAESLSAQGFIVAREPDAIHAVQGRYRPVWGSVFHLGLLVLAMSLVLAATTTRVSRIELIEGQSVADFKRSTGARIDPAALRLLGDMRLTKVDPQFFESYLLFQKLAAQVEWRGRRHDFTLARPLWLDPITYVSIQDFGYAPKIISVAAGSGAVESSTRSLSLFPPGTEDTVETPLLFANVTLRVFPDYAVIGGKDASRSFNLKNPRIRVTAIQNTAGLSDAVAARRLIKVGESLVLPDGSSLTIAQVRKAGTFSVVRSPALPLVALAAAVVMVAVFFRLMRPRVDVFAVRAGEGTVLEVRTDPPQMADARNLTLGAN